MPNCKRGKKFYSCGVKHSGKASIAALKLVGIALIALVMIFAAALIGKYVGTFILEYLTGILILLWVIFSIFTFIFFRDPDAMTPTGNNLVVSPGHGKVDVIDTTTENEFMGGECRRISIFLSVIDIHVQNSPITGKISYFRHMPG